MKTTDMVLVTVNGTPREFAAGLSITDLLDELGLHPGTVVVEHNREIVPRDRLAGEEVRTGDIFELVHFVGGG
jgi:thiamine biosynthesis protein ThiS